MPTQKPTAKKAPAPQGQPKGQPTGQVMGIVDEVRAMGHDWSQKFLGFARHFEKFKDILHNNYELGRDHLQRGNLQDAIMRFRFVLWLDPKYKEAHYFLGCSYLANEEVKKSREAFQRALKQNPESDEARYMLAITTGKSLPKAELPKRIPVDMLLEQFNTMAENFDAQELGQMQYEGHTHLANAVRSALVQGRVDHVLLDLGCGTGLCAPPLRDLASHVSGVDLSPAMLNEAMRVVDAQGRKVYDALIRREVIEFITDGPSDSYDIIVSGGLVPYLGDMQPFFEQCARILRKDGILGFTAEKLGEGTGYLFDADIGRFRHDQFYLADMAARFGLVEHRTREAAIYPETAGWLCVYRKPA